MKKTLILTLFAALVSPLALSGCSSNNASVITVAASELPHAKILNECVKDILKEKGYSLSVTVLDWTIQNDAVANNEYDANYFQHVPYLKTYTGSTKLYAACKCHYEKLCLYAKDTSKMTLTSTSKIELVDDVSNIERALKLLASHNVLTIKDSCYDASGSFTNFDTTNPLSGVTLSANYSSLKLTCLKESQLCQSLSDYDFGIIPGNTALTGLDNLASRIVFGEEATDAMISEKANVIAVKEDNKDSDKTKALVEAFADTRVSEYISKTFGESVIYHYENGLTTNWLV
jgi:D-methionine transport system substrate-binding protein